MQSKATTVEQYVSELPADRQATINALRKVIKKKICPKGFQGVWDMVCWVMWFLIPFYPAGYHCNPRPVTIYGTCFSKKFYQSVSHGHLCRTKLYKWFTEAHAKASPKKLDMGKKLCFGTKKAEDIPLKLIGELASKMTPKEWISLYESAFEKGGTK